MRVLAKKVVTPVLALSLVAGLLPMTAQATPLPQLVAKTDQSVNLSEQARYRRGYGWRHRHHGGRGAAAIVGGIIAGAIIAGAVREGRAADRDMERCADEFRSFNHRTGTYVTYEGNEVVCPYLR